MILPPLHHFHGRHVEKFGERLPGKKVCVVGLGYIGLPTAALLANRGYQVHGVDVNQEAADIINQGKIHIVEPDLDMFVHAAVGSGRLKAATVPEPCDVYMVCVPTPFTDAVDGVPQPDLSYVLAATRAIAPFVKAGDMVILESTSPVGTTEQMADTLREAGVDADRISVAYCPERVLPGKIMAELVENDRIVGGVTKEATQAVAAFYRTFVVGEVLETDSRTAEMSKLTENASRDAQIAFANELSMTCDTLGINVWELIRLANRHPRVDILQPGCGVGGHCIAVDPWFIVAKDPNNTTYIKSAREINLTKTKWCIEKIAEAVRVFEKNTNRMPVIGCFGLSFKPDIDDLRESPALEIYKKLEMLGYHVIASEPNLFDNKAIDFNVYETETVVNNADMVVILVKHSSYKTLKIPKNKFCIDFVGLFPCAADE